MQARESSHNSSLWQVPKRLGNWWYQTPLDAGVTAAAKEEAAWKCLSAPHTQQPVTAPPSSSQNWAGKAVSSGYSTSRGLFISTWLLWHLQQCNILLIKAKSSAAKHDEKFPSPLLLTYLALTWESVHPRAQDVYLLKHSTPHIDPTNSSDMPGLT